MIFNLSVKKIFLFLLLLFSQFSLFSLSNQEILQKILSEFSPNIPGLQETIKAKINDLNDGRWFELESALYAQEQMYEEVLGWSLNIEFWGKNFGYVNDKKLELRSTEYDVVTSNFVFECKLCRNSARFNKIDQFRKERNILLFFQEMRRELEDDRLIVDVNLKQTKKRKFYVIKINGELTNHQDVSFSSKWINANSKEECFLQFLKFLKILSSRSLLIMFKSRIAHSLIDKLVLEGFDYKDGVNFEEREKTFGCCIWVNSICELLKKLSFC